LEFPRFLFRSVFVGKIDNRFFLFYIVPVGMILMLHKGDVILNRIRIIGADTLLLLQAELFETLCIEKRNVGGNEDCIRGYILGIMRAVPQAGQKPDNEKIDKNVFSVPPQGDMPLPPEFRCRSGDIGIVEIFFIFKAEHFSQADGHTEPSPG
jgi:hypothetical protein